MMHTGSVGRVDRALATRVLYVAQTADAREWGISPLQDQQMAGLLMWIPAGTVYAGAAVFSYRLGSSNRAQGSKMRRLTGYPLC